MDNAAQQGKRRRGMLAAVVAGALLLCACSRPAPEAAYAPRFVAPPAAARMVEYSFGVTPMANFRDVYDVFQPIVDHINGGLGEARLVLEVPRGLDEHARQLKSRHFAFALSNPYHSWIAAKHDGYRIFAKLNEDERFRGIWIVPRGSPIATLGDFKGRRVSFPPRSALAATMMTQLQLKQAGVDPLKDIEANYVGSQHASIMEVASGRSEAAATWPLAWSTFQRVHPKEAAQLEARFPTASLVNQGIVARDDVPPALVARVGELLAAMHQSEKGRALLAQVPIGRFEPAGDAQYEVVGTFMEQYRKAFPQVPD